MPILRGEVYFVDLDPTVGHEQAGRRPVVVVSNDKINHQSLVVVVVPGTTRNRSTNRSPANVKVPAGEAGLSRDTSFLTFQVRGLDQVRFQEGPCGILDEAYLSLIDRALAWTLVLPLPPIPLS